MHILHHEAVTRKPTLGTCELLSIFALVRKPLAVDIGVAPVV